MAMVFNRSGASQAIVLNILKAFGRTWHAFLLDKLKSYGILGQVFGLILSSFLSKRQHQVVLDGNSSQEYPFNAGVSLLFQVVLDGNSSQEYPFNAGVSLHFFYHLSMTVLKT